MSVKCIYHGDEARQAIAEGMDCLVKAVSVTAGPHGRTVIIDTQQGIRITKDGYNVAQSLELPNKFGNAGAALLKQIAYHNDERAGDGSTAGIMMAGSIIAESIKAMTVQPDHKNILKGLEDAFVKAEQVLHSLAQPLTFPEGLYEVAYIASNADEQIALALSDIYSDGDLNKKVFLDKGNATETHVEKSNGFRLAAGYASPLFINNLRSSCCTFEHPRLLIVEGKINSLKPITPFLEQVLREKDSLILIAEDFSEEVITGLAVNIKQAGLKAAAIKISSKDTQGILEDLKIASGAMPVSDARGETLDKTDLNLAAGVLQSAKIEKDYSTLVLPRSREIEIKRHIAHLRATLESENEKSERDKIEMRIAFLKDTVFTIYVGGLHDAEIMEKKDRYQDALNSLQMAIKDGVVMGGGVAFLKAARSLMHEENLSNRDEQYGRNMAIKALKAPSEQIFRNAGMNERHTVEKILASSDPALGYDVKSQAYVNMYEAGIIDPVTVTKEALKLALSIGVLMLNTEAAIVKHEEYRRAS